MKTRKFPRYFPARWRARAPLKSALLGIVIAHSMACNADKGFSPSTDAHVLLSRVAFSVHAYNLATVAPYDTVTVHATASMADQTLAPGAIQYTVSDSALRVDIHGHLSIQPGEIQDFDVRRFVAASATVRGQTRTDTAYVSIVGGSPTFVARIDAVPLKQLNQGYYVPPVEEPYDGIWPNFHLSRSIGWVALDSSGVPLTGLVADFRSKDSTIVALFHGSYDMGTFGVNSHGVGKTWILISMYAYGHTITDSILQTVTKPHLQIVQADYVIPVKKGATPELHFLPETLFVATGTDVSWVSPACDSTGVGQPVDVIFDAPQLVSASRVPAFGPAEQKKYDESTTGLHFDSLSLHYDEEAINERGGSGNIPIWRCDQAAGFHHGSAARLFTKPGTYRYRSTYGGPGGVVVVQD